MIFFKKKTNYLQTREQPESSKNVFKLSKETKLNDLSTAKHPESIAQQPNSSQNIFQRLPTSCNNYKTNVKKHFQIKNEITKNILKITRTSREQTTSK